MSNDKKGDLSKNRKLYSRLYCTRKMSSRLTVLCLVVFTSCNSFKKNDSTSSVDSTYIEADTLMSHSQVSETNVNSGPEDNGDGSYQYIQSYLVEQVPDATLFQTISESCALKIELSQKEKDESSQREADWLASEAKSDSIWDATEHDSASIAEREETQMTIADDEMWYRYIRETAQAKLFFLDSLKIPTVTVSENYLKLVSKSGKVWLVDTRSRTEPGTTIIFFNIDKNPILLDRLDMNVNLIRDYFLTQ
jgi:hypothetical protein